MGCTGPVAHISRASYDWILADLLTGPCVVQFRHSSVLGWTHAAPATLVTSCAAQARQLLQSLKTTTHVVLLSTDVHALTHGIPAQPMQLHGAGPCCWATPCAGAWKLPSCSPRTGSGYRTLRPPRAALWSCLPAKGSQVSTWPQCTVLWAQSRAPSMRQ